MPAAHDLAERFAAYTDQLTLAACRLTRHKQSAPARLERLVHLGAECTMTSTPSPTTEPVRLTITVTPEVHAAFRRLADASGMSMGKAMGEWLGDTIEAVEFMAEKMEQARAAPRLVMQEMHAYALGLADETQQVLAQVKKREREGRGSASGARSRAHPAPADPIAPRPVIRGGKSHQGKVGPRGGKSS